MPVFHRILPLVALTTLSLWSSEAFACKCDNIKPVKQAHMGFFGTVESIRQRGSTDAALFKVEKVYKGDEKEAVSVYTNRFHHDCGIRFEEGKSYVVYAYDFRPRGVATSQCWKTYQADAAPTPEEWARPKGKIQEETELEEDLRKLATKIVPRCGRRHDVKDAGFSMIMSGSGDPVPREPDQRVPRDVASFQRCVVDEFLQEDDLPQPDEPALIEGWFQYGDRHYPVLLDQLPCGEECADWGSRVRSAMLSELTPQYGDAALESAFSSCVSDGLDAAGDGSGARGDSARHTGMLIDCAVRRGEFANAKEMLGNAEIDPVFAAAIEWAAATRVEGGYPVSASRPKFPEYWFDEERGKPTPGKFRVLRNQFVAAQNWAHQPLYVEAFAESIVGDEDAPEKMKDIAAVAYHRASYLVPEKAEEFKALARRTSTSKRAQMMSQQLDESLKPPEPEVDPEPQDDLPVDEPVGEPVQNVEQGGGGDDQTLLYVGAGLVLLAMIGIFLIKTRNN